jgi:putative spermidine/putrescine transport system ATP-binding protein
VAQVLIDNLYKQFPGVSAPSVADFSLRIDDGEFVAFLGPSGCGKTTTLRMIAGFIAPSSGSIRIGDIDVTSLPVHKRNTGMVFQRYALFPHMTVRDNVAFGLEMHKVNGAERDTRIRKALDMVRMDHLADRYPRQLSGGQQQRVSIARALAIQPKVFLLDEPLSALDAKLRIEVREEIRELQQRLGLTTVFVTHDQEEALAIADRMAVMFDGRVQQVGTARELYERPANLFVADFLGQMNFFNGTSTEDHRFTTTQGATLMVEVPKRGATKLGVRPERVQLSATPIDGLNALAGQVESTVYLGSQVEVRVRLGDGASMSAQLPNNRALAGAGVGDGSAVYACFSAADCVLFSE